MKICFLAPANSSHTQKWCKWFAEHGDEVHVVSFIDAEIDKTIVHFVDTGASANGGDSQKLKYLLKANIVKRIVTQINPDIVNVHYATSYGTVAALSGLKGYVLSIWGSDIFDFPTKSLLHKFMLKFSLHKAKYIFSTSQAMAKEAHKYTNKRIEITPFGVDMKLFTPNKRNRKDDSFIIGTVKSLEHVYGIDVFLKAVALVKEKNSKIPLKVRIAGKGSKKEEYEKMARDLMISKDISWLGFISQDQAANEWANMDVAIIPSRRESFGVSAVEAEASGIPVIITDIDGLKETTLPDISSLTIPVGDSYALAEKILYLYENKTIKQNMGIAGREFVEKNFEYTHCFETIYKHYIQYMSLEKD